MRLPAPVFSLTLALVFAACEQQPAPTPDTTEPEVDAAAAEAAIRAHVDEFVAAWNMADNAALGPMIAEDIVLMQPDGPLLQGRDAVLATMAEEIDIEMVQQTAAVDEVIVVGDHAYARGTWNVDPTPAAGEEGEAANGKWSVLYARGADGAWQMSRWMWNQDASVPAEE